MALDFAKNELTPEMQKWDQEVCDKGVYKLSLVGTRAVHLIAGTLL